MRLPESDGHDREMGFTLWIVGWLSGFPCLAAPGEGASWPLAALVSLALVAAGLLLVRRAAGARARPGDPAP